MGCKESNQTNKQNQEWINLEFGNFLHKPCVVSTQFVSITYNAKMLTSVDSDQAQMFRLGEGLIKVYPQNINAHTVDVLWNTTEFLGIIEL